MPRYQLIEPDINKNIYNCETGIKFAQYVYNELKNKQYTTFTIRNLDNNELYRFAIKKQFGGNKENVVENNNAVETRLNNSVETRLNNAVETRLNNSVEIRLNNIEERLANLETTLKLPQNINNDVAENNNIEQQTELKINGMFTVPKKQTTICEIM